MRVAVVGISGMGQRHVEALLSGGIASILAGCDFNQEICDSVSNKYKIQSFRSIPALIENFKPEAVIVSTPPHTHFQIAKDLISERIPLLVEKPLASNLLDCFEIVRLANEHQVKIQCGFQMRYCGVIRAILAIQAENLLGQINHIVQTQMSAPISSPTYMSLERTGGIFFEKLCHHVDLFRLFFGEPQRVMAAAAPKSLKHYGVHDNVVLVFQFKDNLQGTILFQTQRPAQIEHSAEIDGRKAGSFSELSFCGDRGTATYDVWSETIDVVQYNHRSDLKSERVSRINVRAEYGEPVYDLTAQINDFLSRVSTNSSLRYPITDSIETMRWVGKAEESLMRNGDWIY